MTKYSKVKVMIFRNGEIIGLKTSLIVEISLNGKCQVWHIEIMWGKSKLRDMFCLARQHVRHFLPCQAKSSAWHCLALPGILR
jgi:hypothetical protein